MKLANPLKRFKDKAQAFLVARRASDLKELAVFKNKGRVTNTFVSAKERDLKKKRKKIANQSRIRNRK